MNKYIAQAHIMYLKIRIYINNAYIYGYFERTFYSFSYDANDAMIIALMFEFKA
jgi:hypothetical protein